MKIGELLDNLDQLQENVTLVDLKRLLERLEMDFHEIKAFAEFSDDRYQRNLLRRTDHYEALLLCFEPGQRTPIHDHAGVSCGVRILQGEAIETGFSMTEDGWIYATGSGRLPTGGVVGSMDNDIHQLSNLQSSGKRLISLHLYSPPLGEVGNYRLEDNSIEWVSADSRQANSVSTGQKAL